MVALCAALIAVIFMSGCQIQAQPNLAINFNGQKVEAADCSYGGEIRSVEAVDANTVVFTLCKADAAFLAKISHPIFAIQDQAVLDQTKGSSNALSAAVNGAGAYQLAQYMPGTEVVLTPSPSYWGIPARPQKITFRWESDPIVRYHDFQSANADVLTSPPSGLIMILRTTAGIKEISTIGLNTVLLTINNRVKPLDNPKVRQALATLVDREDITRSYFVQGSEVASQIIPSRISPGYSGNIAWYTTDANTAKTMLQEAGFDFNQSLTLVYPEGGIPGVDTPAVIAQELKSEFAAVGVNLELKRVSAAELSASIAAGSDPLYLSWFSADYPDGLAFYEKAFISGSDVLAGDYPEIVNAIEALQAVNAEGQRQQAFDRINQLVKDLVPFVPVGHALESVFIRDNLNNLATNGIYVNYPSASNKTGELLIYLSAEPQSLWPADETAPDTFTITRLLYDTLLTPSINGKGYDPLLAESWESSPDLTRWTFHLRYDARFSNAASLDANDVVASFVSIWDRSNPNHSGRTGEFTIFKELFGQFLNGS